MEGVNQLVEECGTDQSVRRKGFLAGSRKEEMARKYFSFDSSKFLGQKNSMYSVSLNLFLYFELLAKLCVVAKGVN